MRIASLCLSLARLASLAFGRSCVPVSSSGQLTTTTATTTASIATTATTTDTTTTSVAPPPAQTFFFTLTSGSSTNTFASNQLLTTNGAAAPVELNPASNSNYQPGVFYIDQSSQYLMSGTLYVAYGGSLGAIYLATLDYVTQNHLARIVVTGVPFLGQPLPCALDGNFAATQFITDAAAASDITVGMSVPPPATGKATIDLIVGDASPYISTTTTSSTTTQSTSTTSEAAGVPS